MSLIRYCSADVSSRPHQRFLRELRAERRRVLKPGNPRGRIRRTSIRRIFVCVLNTANPAAYADVFEQVGSIK
jgi:hypothetical protein